MLNVTIILKAEKTVYSVEIYALVYSTKFVQVMSMSIQVNSLIQVINNNPKCILLKYLRTINLVYTVIVKKSIV